ncbi:MAG: hypothetical protein HY017_14265, partial [Betaproteobacteria bacterium]|nr:hypothetical protein [Betaproteobacteria bacterium]
MPVANARMYSATPAVKQAWKDVLGWALEHAGLAWDLLDYDSPAPLSALWARSDLGCVMMCGLPYTRRAPRPTLVAAPVPSPGRYGARPVYFTDIVVRADSDFRRLEDTFGGGVGYTVEDSMSGCVALRRYLRRFRTPDRPRLYRKAVGGLIHAYPVGAQRHYPWWLRLRPGGRMNPVPAVQRVVRRPRDASPDAECR